MRRGGKFPPFLLAKIMMQPLEQQIYDLARPVLEEEGLTPVLVRLAQQEGRRTLQLLVERQDGTSPTLDECAKINRNLSALLDVEDCIDGAYDLEVGSAGMDRPLVTEQDFTRYAGKEIKLETLMPLDGRKRFRGELKGIESGTITLQVDAEEVAVQLAQVSKAQLVVTDAMVKEALKAKRQSA